ncbi:MULTISPECIES: BrnT family toxin [Cupriavidus]
MRIEFDSAKDEINRAKHGMSLAEAESFEMDTATVQDDDRFPYGEARFIATGLIGERVHVLVFTMRGEAMRVISLRKANCGEVLKYVDEA